MGGKRSSTKSGTASTEEGKKVQPEDDCRCKEVSRKSFPELMKLMIDDLTFRKRGKQTGKKRTGT